MGSIVTTVGASLFTNYLEDPEEPEFIKADYKAIKDSLHQEWDDKQARIRSIKNNPNFRSWISRNLKDSCAEIASLLKIIERQKEEVKIRLLATDTVPSRLAAELIMEQTILHPKTGERVPIEFYPKRDVIVGLRVDDAEVFQTDGLHNFIRRFIGLNKQYGPLILNITGGYKSLIPYLTLVGQINEVLVMYKFEDSEALITIPQLPINFDWELAIEYADQLRNIKKINEYDKCALIDKNILKRNGELAPLGMILKDYAETVDIKDFLEQNLRGDCAEFRWFEYYVSEYPDRMVRRSVGNGEQHIVGIITIQKEADIVVEGDGQIIIAESKPCRYIHDYGDKLVTQIDNLLQEIKHNGLDIHEYHLCLYSRGAEDISEYSQHPAVVNARVIVHKYYPECRFVLNLMRNVRELQRFMHQPFSAIKKNIQSLTIPAT